MRNSDERKFGCPFCSKAFKTRSDVKNHLNQPHGYCHRVFIQRPHAFLSNLNRKKPPRHIWPGKQANSAPEPEDDLYVTDDEDDEDMPMEEYDEDMPMEEYDDEDTSMDIDEPDAFKSCREEYPGAAEITDEAGESFQGKISSDEHAEKRADNIYYPFATSAEWQLASFLSQSSLSVAETDEFLRLELVRMPVISNKHDILYLIHQVKNIGLSFKTTKDLRSRFEILPKVPQWIAVPWPSPGGFPVKKPLTLFYRDTLECLQLLLQNPLLQDYIHYTPFKLYTTAEKTMRVFTGWLSSDDAWDKQVSSFFWRLHYPHNLEYRNRFPQELLSLGP